jgi:hypothetical protein
VTIVNQSWKEPVDVKSRELFAGLRLSRMPLELANASLIRKRPLHESVLRFGGRTHKQRPPPIALGPAYNSAAQEDPRAEAIGLLENDPGSATLKC